MGSHSVDESSLRGSVCVTFLPVMPRNIGTFEAVRYLPKQLFRRITFASSTISTVHLAFIHRPSLSWFTESSSSSARRWPGAAISPSMIGLMRKMSR
ncbi:hypothetical protein EUTSA_v10005191mg [Eutrema salsugineum]|uniref:Uncharacterized protein n=1 Tax=Eutrema salsugineum TaxID=72664 RepID=V4K533_EUTSA|nr:hypothetical protein EUTSA_v10005191mg [Eutrema salsugineum]